MINLTNLDEGLFKDVEAYWNENMPMKAMEECGELIQAISKYEVFLNTVSSEKGAYQKCERLREQLMEELRDVYISLEAIKIQYNIDDNELNGLIEKKLKKKY